MPDDLLSRYRHVHVPEGCGGDLTVASISGLTPERLAEYAGTEHALARVIVESVESRAVGVVPRPLKELLMSRITSVDKGEIQKKKIGRQSVVMPFTYRQRKQNTAAEYFRILSGEANANAGSTVSGVTYPNSSWDIVVGIPDAFKATTSLTNLEDFFLPGHYVYVENLDDAAVAGSRTSYLTAYKVIARENVTSTTAKITIAASYTSAGWTALSSDEKAVHQPTFGIVQIGINNVDNRESWCYNHRADNTRSLLVDWHQTIRYSMCHNDEYDRILDAIMGGKVNEYIKHFQHLPLAEQNKKARLAFENEWMRSVFYGLPIDENQSPNDYESLPQVVDPDTGMIYGYKANALGLRTLLANEGQVIDAKGGPLDLDLLFELCENIKWTRENDGSTVDCINLMTDKDTAHLIDIVLLKYLKDTFGYNVTQFYQPGKVIDATGVARFTYKKYDLPRLGFQLAIFVDQYFTDRVSFFPDGSGGSQGSVDFRSRGRSIWAIDWSDFDIGIVDTASANREYRGEAFHTVNPLFACVITPTASHYELRSTTYTTRLGDAKRSLLIENFSLDECPTVTLSPCAPGYTG